MRKRRVWGACGLVLLVTTTIVGLALRAGQPRFDATGWFTQLEAAHQASLERHKPMLVLISADWCRNCRRLESETLIDPRLVLQIREEFVPVYLDFDEHRRIAEVLEVKSIPSTLVLNPRADLLARVVGYVDATQFALVLGRAADMHRRIDKLGVAVAAESDGVIR